MQETNDLWRMEASAEGKNICMGLLEGKGIGPQEYLPEMYRH